MDCEIKRSIESEADTLSDIRVASKGHWGYSEETLEEWRPLMRISEDYIRSNIVFSIYIENTLSGFYAIRREKNEDFLDHLWLLPEVIGMGVGLLAIEHATREAAKLSIASLTIISDADAEGFYQKVGAVRTGEFFSEPQNRMLPVLRLDIPDEQNQTVEATSP